jgi:hypothetical protein
MGGWRRTRSRSVPCKQANGSGGHVLRTVVKPAKHVALSEVSDQTATEMLKFVRSHGLEGIIAKRSDSVYQPGKRIGAWSKHRINRSPSRRDSMRHFFDPGDDFSPQSMQPVIHLNEDGEPRIEMMRWAFKLPDRPRPLFNARSEGIERAKFWKDAFLKGRCIVPGDAIFEWQEVGEKQEETQVRVRYSRPGAFWNGSGLEALEKSEVRALGADLRRPDGRAK